MVKRSQVGHVGDNRQVDDQQRNMEEAEPAKQFMHFEGQVEGGGDQRNPFRPGPSLPKPISLHEAQRGIGKRNAGDCPQLLIGQTVSPAQKNVGKVAIGADMQEVQQIFGDFVGVFVKQEKNAAARLPGRAIPLANSSDATARRTLTWPLLPRQAGPT